jgi:hypothetical protein
MRCYPELRINLPKYFVLLLSNDKVGNFGGEENYLRYLLLCVEEVGLGGNRVRKNEEEGGKDRGEKWVERFVGNVHGFESLVQ